jgi:hypothetical protein
MDHLQPTRIRTGQEGTAFGLLPNYVFSGQQPVYWLYCYWDGFSEFSEAGLIYFIFSFAQPCMKLTSLRLEGMRPLDGIRVGVK